MASSRAKLTAWTVVALLVIANLAVAFPFWLDSPTRSNKYDQKSPFHTPVPVGTITDSPTASPTPSSTPVPGSPTDTPTPTPIYTATNTQVSSPTFTFTPTPVVTSPVVDNFEGPDATVDNWGFPVDVTCTSNSSIVAEPNGDTSWVAGDANAAGNGGGSAVHLTGSLAVSSADPLAHIDLNLNASGATTDTSLSAFTGVQFDFKADAAGVTYNIGLENQASAPPAGDSGFYEFQFTPADLAWHTYVVYFPPVPIQGYPATVGSTIIGYFTQPGWAAPVAWTNKAGIIRIMPEPEAASVNYGMWIDNVGFVSSTRAAAPAIASTSNFLVDTMECNLAENSEDCNGPYTAGNISMAMGAVAGVNITDQFVSPPFNNGVTLGATDFSTPGENSGLDPMSGGSNSMHLSGTLPPGAYANCQFSLIANGYGYGPNQGLDFTGGQGPHNRLVFDTMSSTPSVPMACQITTKYTPSSGFVFGTPSTYQYNFFTFNFNASGTWTTKVCYLPGAPYGPTFQIVSGNPYNWTDNGVANNVQALLFFPANYGATTIPFDLWLDNIRFD
jgi:hypothetical protein